MKRVALGMLFFFCAQTFAEVRVGGLFSEGMVLQQGRAAAIWGTADGDEKVTVRFRDREVAAVAREGRWSVAVQTGEAGGPFPLTIAGTNTISLKSVFVGEVWLCSGQSNMGYPVATRPNPKALAGLANPRIRLFTVPERLKDTPQSDLPGAAWEECGAETVGKFSAVGYYFGRDLQKALDVPVGLIHASYGGSSASQWIDAAALAKAAGLGHLQKGKLRSALYNGMIAPLVPYGIRGVIWYQGEADTSDAWHYRELFTSMIGGWRSEFGQGDFPFLFVQIAPYKKIVTEPQESAWAELREAQRLVSRSVKNAAMVVVTDWGHEAEIHVRTKEPVGQRLALAALGNAYDKKVEWSGPMYRAMKIEGDKIELEFTHVGGGLETRAMVLEEVVKNPRTGESGGAMHVRKGVADGVALTGFAVAGEDGRFFGAEAKILGDRVIVRSAQVSHPISVRYGWSDYPTGNLFNKEGLPASPFWTASRD